MSAWYMNEDGVIPDRRFPVYRCYNLFILVQYIFYVQLIWIILKCMYTLYLSKLESVAWYLAHK